MILEQSPEGSAYQTMKVLGEREWRVQRLQGPAEASVF